MNNGIKQAKDYLRKQKEDMEMFKSETGYKKYSGFSPTDWEVEDEIKSAMSFETVEDLDFEVMDFFFGGRLSRMLRWAGIVAKQSNWQSAYDEFKWLVADFVGWESKYVSKERHPALCSSEAYSLVLDYLYKACFEGEDGRRKKRDVSEYI